MSSPKRSNLRGVSVRHKSFALCTFIMTPSLTSWSCQIFFHLLTLIVFKSFFISLMVFIFLFPMICNFHLLAVHLFVSIHAIHWSACVLGFYCYSIRYGRHRLTEGGKEITSSLYSSFIADRHDFDEIDVSKQILIFSSVSFYYYFPSLWNRLEKKSANEQKLECGLKTNDRNSFLVVPPAEDDRSIQLTFYLVRTK